MSKKTKVVALICGIVFFILLALGALLLQDKLSASGDNTQGNDCLLYTSEAETVCWIRVWPSID